MHRVRCETSVQTDAEAYTDQSTQISLEQCTQWTQCAVSQTDQSVQATCTTSVANVQVAAETAAAAIQISPAVVEPAESAASGDKCDAATGIHSSMLESVSPVSKQDILQSRSATDPVIEAGEELTTHRDLSSFSQQMLLLEHSTLSLVSGAERTVSTETPLSSTAISVATERLSAVSDQSDVSRFSPWIPCIVQNQCPTITMTSVCHSAVPQPAFVSSTATKCLYSFEQQTVLARSLTLRQSNEINQQVGHTQKTSVQQLLHDTHTNMPAVDTDNAVEQTSHLAVTANTLLNDCTTNVGQQSSEAGNDQVTVTSAAALDSPASGTPSVSVQQNVSSLRADSGSSLTHLRVGQEIALTSSALPTLQSVHTDSTSDEPMIMLTASPNVNCSSALELPVSAASNKQYTQHSPPRVTTSVNDTKLAEGVLVPGGDFIAFSGNEENAKGLEYDNVNASAFDQSMCGESQSSTHNNESFNSVQMTGNTDNKAEKAVAVSSKMDSKVTRLHDDALIRGRSRRPLFAHRGPLMETEMTSEGSDSTSRKLHKDSEPSCRKLPVMLLGMLFALISDTL